ncbi:MAG: hypothetical protein L0Z62_38405, partial [Gemmataceae bacterium]|nr:hypothetical protein [Gemmataceae bacterium]
MSLHHRLDRIIRTVPRNRRQARRYRPRLEVLEQRETPTITVFQQGVGGYTGTQDTQISAGNADTVGDLQTVQVTGPGNSSGQIQGLIRFDNLFGPGANQIPIGARINAAALTVEVPTMSNFNVVLFRMLADWTEASTWNALGGGVQTNNVEAATAADSSLSPAQGLGPRAFNVTSSVQTWSYNAQANTVNRGWVLVMPSGDTSWQFASSETTSSRTPILAVDWTAPTAGTFDFSAASYTVNENIGTATITVNRNNGGLNVVAVNYAATNGTATGGQDFTAVSGTLVFAANEFSKTFTIPITKDTVTEADETINLTLSNAAGGAVLGAQASSVLTIRDQSDIVQFSVANVTVAENVGNVTITVSRTGLGGGAAAVQYATGRGSATAGQDFTATSGTLIWVDGDTAPKTFTVAIINDTLVEATERLNLVLSNPAGTVVLGSQSTATLIITDNEAAVTTTVTFQQGAAGYTGTQDTEINSTVTTPQGGNTEIDVDEDRDGIVRALIRFDNLFGTGTGQIPLGATITAATLTLHATEGTEPDGVFEFYRMLVDWNQATAIWTTFGANGPNLNNVTAVSP